MAPPTIPARLMHQARVRPSAPAYSTRGPDGWVATSWKDYADETRQAARALMALGLEPGGSVAILGFNTPEWAILDLACMCAGGCPAGIYTTNSPAEVQYIASHSESLVVLVENQDQWDKVDQVRGELPDMKKIVLMRGDWAPDDPDTLRWEDFLALGDAVEDSALDARIEGLKPDDRATFIYTSGTTGPPKAVMLSHKNLAFTANVALGMVDFHSGDRTISYLPLSHIAEQMFTLHGPISAGSQVFFAESIEKMPENLPEVLPTVFFGVPRIWEKIYAKFSAGLAAAEGPKAKLANWALGVGAQTSPLKMRGEPVGGLLGLKYLIANKLIFSKLKDRVGLGEAKVCVSGAAPIAPEILEFFASMDLIIQEVYGQSEDCGPTTFNGGGAVRFGTVGQAISGVEVRIADDGEICVRGDNVFLGYFKDQEATDATLIDGWLHSGDLGALDDDEFLTITGRKKDIIITAGGKNIAPKNIEESLKVYPLIEHAVVIGDRRKFLSALITLDMEAAQAFAAERGLSGDLRADDDIRAEVQRAVDEVNAQFARVEHVRKFTIPGRSLTIEDGELTPTLKVKRAKVYAHFATEIEAIYAE